MDFKQIQELIKMINKSNIGEVTIEEKGFKVIIKQKEEPAQNFITGNSQMPVSYAQQPQPQASQSVAPPSLSDLSRQAGRARPRQRCAPALAADGAVSPRCRRDRIR